MTNSNPFLNNDLSSVINNDSKNVDGDTLNDTLDGQENNERSNTDKTIKNGIMKSTQSLDLLPKSDSDTNFHPTV